MVEVRFWRYDPMVRRLVHTFMLGTREMRHFRTIKIFMHYTVHTAKYGCACTDMDFKCVDRQIQGYAVNIRNHYLFVKTLQFF